MESIGVVVIKNIQSFKNIEKIKSSRNGVFLQKAMKNVKILSEILKTKVMNLDDYSSPKIQNLIFKDAEYDWRSSDNPFCHAKTLHCAERKAFAYGTWSRCFLIDCELSKNFCIILCF